MLNEEITEVVEIIRDDSGQVREIDVIEEVILEKPENHHHHHHEHEVDVEITYNGVTKPLRVNLNEIENVALEAGLNLFNITTNRHIMALYTEAGVELIRDKALREQGVKKCDLLALRQSAVLGGIRC